MQTNQTGNDTNRSEKIHLEVGNTSIDITTNTRNMTADIAPEDTDKYSNNSGQGSVQSSADGRLKENRQQKDNSQQQNQDGGKGAVKDPEHDRRLKENRQKAQSVHIDKSKKGILKISTFILSCQIMYIYL